MLRYNWLYFILVKLVGFYCYKWLINSGGTFGWLVQQHRLERTAVAVLSSKMGFSCIKVATLHIFVGLWDNSGQRENYLIFSGHCNGYCTQIGPPGVTLTAVWLQTIHHRILIVACHSKQQVVPDHVNVLFPLGSMRSLMLMPVQSLFAPTGSQADSLCRSCSCQREPYHPHCQHTTQVVHKPSQTGVQLKLGNAEVERSVLGW